MQKSQIISNLAAITNLLIDGLKTGQLIANYLVYISRLNLFGIRIVENETWEGVIINDYLVKPIYIRPVSNEIIVKKPREVDGFI
ncbi:unnamed protein product [Cunninghamella blakesleeana]